MTRIVPSGDTRFWRSAGADAGALEADVAARFPAAARLVSGADRRQFLRVMAASIALAGLSGCDDDDPRSQEIPPVRQRQGEAPGRVLTYASSALVDGFANGVMVTTRDGRPIKIEGSDRHPWSRGGTDAFGQASVLGLYDPFRSQTVKRLARDSDWQALRVAMVGVVSALRADQGDGLRILLGPSTSPSLRAQLAALQAALPKMHVHCYASVDRSAMYEGSARAFGRALEAHWDFSPARIMVSFDGDVLDAGPQQVGASRQWAAARRRLADRGELLALHAVSCVPSLTSARADFALAANPALIEAMAQSLLAKAEGGSGPALDEAASHWCARAGAALDASRGAGIVCAGTHGSAVLHETVQRINAAYGNTGKTVLFTDPVPIRGESIADLARAMRAGEVRTLLMIGCNPVYEAPADVDFAAALTHVPVKLHAGPYEDETALRSDWHLPLCHALESWDDARSLDGTPGLVQPTIAPLYDGRTAQEILSLLFDEVPRSALQLLQDHWRGTQQEETFAPAWRQALLDGFFKDDALPLQNVQAVNPLPGAASARPGGLTVAIRPDPSVWDGSLADNAWLQELPKPLTKLVWENAVGVSPGLADAQGLAQGDELVVTAGGRQVTGAAYIMHGQADDVVSLTLGYGRDVADQLSAGLGYNAGALRTLGGMWHLPGASIKRTGGRRILAATEEHSAMQGSGFVRVQAPGAAQVPIHAPLQPSLYPAQQGDGRAWGMVIDLDSCIGCNACVVACQAENNIAVVGRDQMLLGRGMHWLRVDRNAAGTAGPASHFMPVPCMHCEQAPCEVGCPVEATLHDQEGLNLMVYNRCVGTRACSGYCPYKVRKFNYLDYAAAASPSVAQQYNPDVTVRARGVMEKCTFCVQRIAEARIQSDRDEAPIPDGAVRTACQGACPTNAITFGDLADSTSKVAAAHADPRRYALLEALNTRPRTTYLAKLAPPPGEG
jgi:molybdopterin-containing oxidoreductase family iron-sulfur binding subunit